MLQTNAQWVETSHHQPFWNITEMEFRNGSFLLLVGVKKSRAPPEQLICIAGCKKWMLEKTGATKVEWCARQGLGRFTLTWHLLGQSVGWEHVSHCSSAWRVKPKVASVHLLCVPSNLPLVFLLLIVLCIKKDCYSKKKWQSGRGKDILPSKFIASDKALNPFWLKTQEFSYPDTSISVTLQ